MSPSPKKSSPKKAQGVSHSRAQYISWFTLMYRMRRLEERCGQLYGQQKIRGFCHLYIGQEACAAGAVSALRPGDKYITAYRDHGLALASGISAKEIIAELYGKKTGCSKGKGGSMHLFSHQHHFLGGHGIVGGQIPLGVGIAFAEKYRRSEHLCITFMGDGAVRQGAFHESLNLAMIYGLPLIFVIENNGYAMGTSVARTSNVEELYRLGSAYDIPSVSVDGMRVEAVHEAIASAAVRARKQQQSSLIELKTYRYKGHSMSDPAGYREKEELEAYRKQDPVKAVMDICVAQKFLTQKGVEKITQAVEEEMQEAVQFAEESPFPDAKEAFEDVYTDAQYPFTTD